MYCQDIRNASPQVPQLRDKSQNPSPKTPLECHPGFVGQPRSWLSCPPLPFWTSYPGKAQGLYSLFTSSHLTSKSEQCAPFWTCLFGLAWCMCKCQKRPWCGKGPVYSRILGIWGDKRRLKDAQRCNLAIQCSDFACKQWGSTYGA
jgi:hypothetical protein